MGTATVVTLVVGFLFGGLMLALVVGYLSTEEARAQEAQQRADGPRLKAGVLPAPGFFAVPYTEPLPAGLSAFDDALLACVERHVKAEQALVTQFVHQPSIDTLYRQGRALRAN